MVKRRLYVQLCLVFAASLLIFAILVTILWKATGHEQYESAIFQKTTALGALLLPPVDAEPTSQAAQVQRVGDALDIDITLWSPRGDLLGSRGVPAVFPVLDLAPGGWVPSNGQTIWNTKLLDGRTIVVTLDRISVPDDTISTSISLFLLACFIAAASYPFIRRITKRLEHLQEQVLQIGSGDLSARVAVKGNDEIAWLADSFNKSAEQIEALVTAQRLLLANASHELRTPLSRIRLGIEMLQTKGDLSRREALQTDIEELDELIDELILMTRLDTGLQHKEFELVDLTALTAEECARYRDCELMGTGVDVMGDRRMLQHLVRNLIDNAFVHGKPPITVEISPQKDEVQLIVSDNGNGIPDHEQENVFQPFYRAGDRQSVPGYGLGLPLVKRIAALHEASITIKNQPHSQISVSFKIEYPTSVRH